MYANIWLPQSYWRNLSIVTNEMVVNKIQHDCCGGTHVHSLQRPYAHLGKVNVNRQYCFKWSVNTDTDVLSPGCGCDRQVVEDIAEALQERKVARGNIEIMRLHEALGVDLDSISTLLDAILVDRKIKSSVSASSGRPVAVKRDHISYDVSSLQDQCGGACAPMFWTTTVILEEDEIIKRDEDCCGQSDSRRPYAQLGAVYKVDSSPGYMFCPGRSLLGGMYGMCIVCMVCMVCV